MTDKEKMKALYFWQNVGVVHELTCRDCGGHTKLAPLIRGQEIVLECPKCCRIQERIPECVFNYVEKATTKRWEATDETDVKIEIVMSFLQEQITCRRERSIFGVDLAATATFEEFLNKTDEYEMQVLIKDFFGSKILSQIKKVIKRFQKRKIMYSKILSSEELKIVLY